MKNHRYEKYVQHACIDCGKVRKVILRKNQPTSLRCVTCAQKLIDHSLDGYKHGGWGTRLYTVWVDMKQRCFNQNNKKYPRYGARGITVCDEWLDFAVFRDFALSHGYDDTLTIDRIDNDDSYKPTNCQFLSRSEHSRKTMCKFL